MDIMKLGLKGFMDTVKTKFGCGSKGCSVIAYSVTAGIDHKT